MSCGQLCSVHQFPIRARSRIWVYGYGLVFLTRSMSQKSSSLNCPQKKCRFGFSCFLVRSSNVHVSFFGFFTVDCVFIKKIRKIFSLLKENHRKIFFPKKKFPEHVVSCPENFRKKGLKISVVTSPTTEYGVTKILPMSRHDLKFSQSLPESFGCFFSDR